MILDGHSKGGNLAVYAAAKAPAGARGRIERAYSHDGPMVDGFEFVAADRMTPDAVYVDRTLGKWVAAMTVDERSRLLDKLYAVPTESIDVESESDEPLTTGQWAGELPKNLPAIVESISKMDKETHDMTIMAVKKLLSLGARNVPDLFRDAGTRFSESIRAKFGR